MRKLETIDIFSNFHARLVHSTTKQPLAGSDRVLHNVFTTTGRDWLAHLVAWKAIGTPETPYTNRRIRWMSVGTGTQAEVEGVTALVTPVMVTDGMYLSAVQSSDFPSSRAVRFYKEFGANEISFGDDLVVPVTEAGLFVDVFPVSTGGGSEDEAVGDYDTTLNPESEFNAPVAYATFDVINKMPDFNLEIQWEFRF